MSAGFGDMTRGFEDIGRRIAENRAITPVATERTAPPTLTPESWATQSADLATLGTSAYQKFSSGSCNIEGCIGEYCRGPVPSFIDVESLAPWVKVVFGRYENGSDLNNPVSIKEPDITVGNNPSPRWGNMACVKSFEYQLKDGNTCKLEIVDQQGGVFSQYAEAMAKCSGQLRAASPGGQGAHGVDLQQGKYFLQIQWGWTVQACEGDPPQIKSSPVITFLNQSIRINYQGGLVKYTIEGIDMMQTSFVARTKNAYGEAGKPMEATQAIKELMCDGPPQMCVQFTDKQRARALKSDADNKSFKFKTFSAKGGRAEDSKPGRVLSTWQAETQAKLQSASRWLEPLQSPNGKGFIFTWDNTNDQPCVLVFVDPSPECGADKIDDTDIHLGTYIVNGGPKSAVLTFTGNINFIGGFALRAQGGTNSSTVAMREHKGDMCSDVTDADIDRAMAENAKNSNTAKPATDASGRTMASNPDGDIPKAAYGDHAPTRAREVSNAIRSNKKAGAIYANIQPIDGELRIQGNPDPRFCDNRIRGYSWVSIVVINPFYLSGEKSPEGDDVYWQVGDMPGIDLEHSACNQVLSNPNWQILGCTHSIKEGTYHTTLHVRLLVPGFDIKAGQPVGGTGNPKVGWSPKDLKNTSVNCAMGDKGASCGTGGSPAATQQKPK